MPRIVCSVAFAGGAEGLTGVSAANNVRSNNVSPVDFFDVAMIDHLWPMLAKYLASVRVDF
jgi:hypothetical protein